MHVRWIAVLLCLVASQAWAQGGQAPRLPGAPFTERAFADAQKAGKPIVVFVHATW